MYNPILLKSTYLPWVLLLLNIYVIMFFSSSQNFSAQPWIMRLLTRRVTSENVCKHTLCKWIIKCNMHEAFLINKWNTAYTAQSWQQGTINFSPVSQLASSVLADGMVEVVEFVTVVALGITAPPELMGWSGSRSRDRETRLRDATWLDAEGSTEVLSGLDEVRRTKLAVVLGLLVSMADPETASSLPGAPSSVELSPCWK